MQMMSVDNLLSRTKIFTRRPSVKVNKLKTVQQHTSGFGSREWRFSSAKATYWAMCICVVLHWFLPARCAAASTSITCRRVSLCPAVRLLSVTSRCSTEMAKRRITQVMPHDSAENLVFWCRKSRQNSNEIAPDSDVKCRWGTWLCITLHKNIHSAQSYGSDRLSVVPEVTLKSKNASL